MHRARYGEKAQSFHGLPSAPISPNLRMFTNPEVPKPSSWGFLWRHHYTGTLDCIIGHWQGIQPPTLFSPPQRSRGWEWKLQTSILHHSSPLSGKLPGQPAFYLRCGPRIINITKNTFFCFHHLGNSRGFRSTVSKMGSRPNTYSLEITVSYDLCFFLSRGKGVCSICSWTSELYRDWAIHQNPFSPLI